MLTPQSSHEGKRLRDEADYLSAKAKKYRRWGLILANAGLPDLAGEHLGRAERYAEIADALHSAAHVVANAERDRRAA